MPSIIRITIPITELSQKAIELRNKEYDRFAFSVFDKHKRFIELRAWKYKARPDKKKIPAI